MKILIVSDSHGDCVTLNKIVKLNSDAKVIIHAGDYKKDALEIEQHNQIIYSVLGNCDEYRGYYEGEETQEFSLGTQRIFLTHGHLFGVKRTLTPLVQSAIQSNAQIAVYGHTHIPNIENIAGVLCVNPGSASGKRGVPTYAILTLNNKGDLIDAKIMCL